MTTDPTQPVAVPVRRQPVEEAAFERRGLTRLLTSARMRIVGWYMLLLAFALVMSIFAVRQVLLVQLEEQIEQDLAQEVEELRELATGEDPADGLPFGNRVDRIFDVFLRRNIPAPNETMITFIGGETYLVPGQAAPVRLYDRPELVQLWAHLDTVERGTTTVEEVGEIDYLAVPLRTTDGTAGVFVVAMFSDLARAGVTSVVRTAFLVGGAALVLASVLAWSVASRLLAPVRDVTRTARDISETDLNRRIAVTTDDELGELAATFNGMLARLDRAFTTQRDFADDAGHELRTPITIIRGHLELLEDDPAERAETLALVLDELDRMNRMVEDLLLLAKSAQRDFLNLETVDLEALTREVRAKSEALGDREWVLEATGRGRIVADRQRLTQAVVQLAQNATQHSAPGTAVSLGSAVEDGHARLWVRDQGTGIAPEDQQRIFERFGRGTGGPRRSEGAGLGLAIVKAIAEAHHGWLELSSRPGAGATFTVVIPVDQPAAEGAQP